MGPKVKKQKSILDFRFQQEKSEELIDLTNEQPQAILCPVCSTAMDQWAIEVRIRHVEDCLSVLAIKEEAPGNLEVVEFSETREVKIETKIERAEGPRKRNETERPKRASVSRSEVKLESVKSKSPENPPKKKRKLELFGAQKEMSKYINTKPKKARSEIKKETKKEEMNDETTKNDNKTKKDSSDKSNQEIVKPNLNMNEQLQEQPGELLPSSRKLPIPDLKILRFKISNNRHYEVSMDAFRYKPHESITQYFLSHFHSDHYGGITKRWCSERTLGPKIVYCSPITSKLLTLRFGVDPKFIYEIGTNTRHKVYDYALAAKSEEDPEKVDKTPEGESGENIGYSEKIDDSKKINDSELPSFLVSGGEESASKSPGLYVTSIDANHCPGAVIFLFESISLEGVSTFTLHCGDFRISRAMIDHPALQPFQFGQKLNLEKVYLDTTYMSPKYNFPKQELVCGAVADMFEKVTNENELFSEWFGLSLQSRITDFLSMAKTKKKKFLVLVGTYLIGKERLAISILRRMGECPIYVLNINSRGDKAEIIRAFEDPYLSKVITNDDLGTTKNNSEVDSDVVVHLVPMKIVGSAQELSNYFNHNQYFKHFERCVGLRPTGWSFEDNGNEEILTAEDEVPQVDDVSLLLTLSVLRSHPEYLYMDILRQNRPKADKKMDKLTFKIYLLPYSEHLSYRELLFFVVFLNIGKVIPTVNTENAWSASRMEDIIQKWELVRHIKATRNSTLPEGLKKMIYDLTLDDF